MKSFGFVFTGSPSFRLIDTSLLPNEVDPCKPFRTCFSIPGFENKTPLGGYNPGGHREGSFKSSAILGESFG